MLLLVVAVVLLVLVFSPCSSFWQELEPIQASGMALERCILGKFLGAVCHCFPLSLDVTTFRRQIPPRPQQRERS
jgi:hypothetical protein